jgi:predicted RNase H-like HicB family nuclease
VIRGKINPNVFFYLNKKFNLLKKIIMRQIILYPGEDGYWIVECPSLPGCISQGKTKEKAIENIKEAIEGYIISLKEDSLPIPEEKFETLLIAI